MVLCRARRVTPHAVLSASTKGRPRPLESFSEGIGRVGRDTVAGIVHLDPCDVASGKREPQAEYSAGVLVGVGHQLGDQERDVGDDVDPLSRQSSAQPFPNVRQRARRVLDELVVMNR